MKKYRNAERTNKWIKKAFVELLHEKGDIEKISVNELAERADISKTTFYYHYADIYAVAEEYGEELLRMLTENIEKADPNNNLDLHSRLINVVNFLKANESEYRMVINSSITKNFVEKLKVILSQKLFEKSNVFSLDPNTRKVQMYFLTSGCVDTIVAYFSGNFDMTLDNICEVIMSIITQLKNYLNSI